MDVTHGGDVKAYPLGVESLSVRLAFGLAAFGPWRPRPEQSYSIAPMQASDQEILATLQHVMEQSVPNLNQMKAADGQVGVTQMLAACYKNGLSSHGEPHSVVNSEIIRAIRFIFDSMSILAPTDPKRVACLSTLARTCKECQQVLAREILRIFGDLTAQNETLERQLKRSLLNQKEAALDHLIRRRHPNCSSEQRPHIINGYLCLIGDAFGLDGVAAAENDQFLADVRVLIGDVDLQQLATELQQELSVKNWLTRLLADINNQSTTADRLISRDCLFKWVQANATGEAAHLIFYSEDRLAEFEGQIPACPSMENQWQPFLSCRVLVEILVGMGMLVVH